MKVVSLEHLVLRHHICFDPAALPLHEGLIEPALAAVRNGIAGTELPAAADKSAYTQSKQKSHAQYAENTFLQDDVDSVFRFIFDQMVSVFQGLLFTYWCTWMKAAE